jgi:transposase
MARKARMATLWQVSDSLWERIQPVLDTVEGPKSTGRPRADRRRVLDGIIFQLRTGCPWNRIPSAFGDDSTIHRYFRNWKKWGIFGQIWDLLVQECRELEALEWWTAVARKVAGASVRLAAVGHVAGVRSQLNGMAGGAERRMGKLTLFPLR